MGQTRSEEGEEVLLIIAFSKNCKSSSSITSAAAAGFTTRHL
jgi:hypothetical protein